MSKELRGHGTVYKRGYTWWIQYCKNGKSYSRIGAFRCAPEGRESLEETFGRELSR
jgi:hypothetical protein